MQRALNSLRALSALALLAIYPVLSPAQENGRHSFSRYAVSCPYTEPLLQSSLSSHKQHSLDLLRGAFTPHVIRNDRTEPVIFTATISGARTNVTLEIDGAEQTMYDDGTHGDATAEDGAFTLSLPAEQITSRLADSDVFRPFLGFVNVREGDVIAFRYNVFAEIWTPSITLVSVTQLSPVLQFSPHIFNIKNEVQPDGTAFDPRFLAREFYRWFGDDYDFIHFLLVPGFRGNRHHVTVQNATRGLGLGEFDDSSLFGSDGRLKGYNVFPIPFFFDGAGRGFIHEIGHQWINFLDGTPLASGIPHWPFSSVASGVMGFSIPGSGAGGTFAKRIDPEGDGYRVTSDPELQFPLFNDMELYLMGLLPPDAVSPILVFNDQSQFPANGLYPASEFTEVSIEDIVSVAGAREPGVDNTQIHFKIATIVVSDELLTPEEIAFYDYFTQRGESLSPVPVKEGFLKGSGKPFYVATGERATLDLDLGLPSTAVPETVGEIPEDFWLGQNYPNPFNPETIIEYSLERAGPVELVIFNQRGQKVRSLLKQSMVQAGKHLVLWDGKGDNNHLLPSGHYYYQIRTANSISTKRAVLLK